jgi:ribonuclease HII
MGAVSLQTIETQAALMATPAEALDFLRAALKDDPRKAAQVLLRRHERRAGREAREARRMAALWDYETRAREKGASAVAGIDEAGRGPLVGPVVAAAVILPPGTHLPGLDDSKKLSPETRERLDRQIRSAAQAVGVGQAGALEVDDLNIYRASQTAMERAVEALPVKPDHLLLDAMILPRFRDIPQDRIVHGDALSASVAAASIVAKVARDRMMIDLDSRYPVYGFAVHKGYGTEEHLRALREHGPCPEHRRTFGPVAAVLGGVPADAGPAFWEGTLRRASTRKELEEAGRLIRAVGRKKLGEKDLQSLRALYRARRSDLPS